MGKKKQYKLTTQYEIIDKMRYFTEVHIRFDKNINRDVVNSSANTRIITSVTDYSNGDCCRYDVTTIALGDIEVSVQMLTIKIGDKVEVYLAPYDIR